MPVARVPRGDSMPARLGYWWRRKPPPSRILISVGSASLLALGIIGLALDAKGEAFAKEHSFLVSVPRGLFGVVALGLAGVLVIERLKNWSGGWQGINALAPALVDKGRRFVVE